MTFNDRAANWKDQPLTEPRLVADVLDLLVKDSDRDNGAIHIVLCDPDDKIIAPLAIDDVPVSISLEERVQALTVFAHEVAQAVPGGAVLIAVARPGGLSCTEGDRLWRRAAEQVSADEGIRLLGVHVVTSDGSRPVPVSKRKAA